MDEEIVICMGSSCFSRGNRNSLGIIKKYLREKGLENSITFRGAHCFGECENGPVLMIGERKFTRVSPERVTELLDSFFSGQHN